MALPPVLRDRLRLPLIGSPLFIISSPELVIAQCKAGIIGSFPALNARSTSMLDEWLHQITEELAIWDRDHPDTPAAPFAVNHIVHKSSDRLEPDVEASTGWQVPVIFTSLGAREDVNAAVHSYGGIVLHDVINDRFAHQAIEKGADGLIPVAAGADGHAGHLSPFALVQALREWFDGPIALSGSIAHGRSILGAQAMGADLAYAGSVFIAAEEADAPQGYTNLFTGVHGNHRTPSVIAAGLNPIDLPKSGPSAMDFGSEGNQASKACRDIWGCDQGIGAVKHLQSVGEVVTRLSTQYEAAKAELAAKTLFTSERGLAAG